MTQLKQIHSVDDVNVKHCPDGTMYFVFLKEEPYSGGKLFPHRVTGVNLLDITIGLDRLIKHHSPIFSVVEEGGKPMNIIDAVVELNSEICEDNPKLCGEGIEFVYCSNGFAEIVNFMGYTVYNSESDIEEDVEAVGGIKQYLIVKVREYIDLVGKISIFKDADSLDAGEES